MDVDRIQTGAGSPEGANSAYLLPDCGLVVDPGPPGGDAWSALRGGIADAGVDVAEVDDVFVTHWHVDHAGLAVRLAEAAGAAVHLHSDDAPLVGDYARERAERLDRDAARLREWGVPNPLVEERRSADAPSQLPDTYPVEAHADGDRVAGLDVLHAPGHTLGHACLADAEGGHLFAGDALLPTYTPNVGGGDTRMDDPLSAYLGTLDRLDGLGWTGVGVESVTVHPGHGERVAFPGRLETIRDHHRERTERVVDAVASAASATPWAVATALFGDLSGVHVKMGAGEAAAHLARLERLGAVATVGEDPLRYAAVEGEPGSP